jgi:5'(3')-deoxyribonucleotidase
VETKPSLLFDLDDVIVSFRKGAAKAHGWTWDEVERRGLAARTWHMGDWFDMTQEEFWEPINLLGDIFWRSLEINPWAHALIALAQQSGLDWYIATSPSLSKDQDAMLASYIGKITWLSNFLGADLHRAHITPHKHMLGGPGDILIDDSPANIEAFEKRGGRGILFPLLGNANHAERHNPMPYVRDALCKLM